MEKYKILVNKAIFSYSKVEQLVIYFEAEARKIPLNLIANNGNVGRHITPDFQKLIASY